MAPSTTGKSVDFTPDEDFSSAVESGKKLYSTDHPFLKDLKRVQVEIDTSTEEGREKKRKLEQKIGKAIVGLYWDDEGTAHFTDKEGDEELIDTTMELGVSGKGQLLVVCETGIANYVRELADDDGNHLPNTKTGVVIHYVVEGIARDFGTTFDRQPVSLGGNRGRSASKSGRDAGKIILSKAEKNKLLEKLDMSNYQDDIADGTITMEDAMKSIQEALQQKMEYEKLGYYLSPNKTEGVLLYDWKKIVDKSWGDKCHAGYASNLYTAKKIEVVIPDLFSNYYENNHSKANKKNAQHLLKSSLATTVMEDAFKFGVKSMQGDKGLKGFEIEGDITSNDDILEHIGYDKEGTVMGIHLAKLKQPGMMKPRYVVVDVMDADGMQILYLYHQKSVLTISNQFQ